MAVSSTSEAALTAQELDSPLFTFFFVDYAEKNTSSGSLPITACLEQARTLSVALTSLDYGTSQTKSGPRLVYSDPKAAHFRGINARDECDARPRRSEPWSTLLASVGLAFPGQSAAEHFSEEFQLWLNGVAMPALQSVAQAGFLRDDRVLNTIMALMSMSTAKAMCAVESVPSDSPEQFAFNLIRIFDLLSIVEEKTRQLVNAKHVFPALKYTVSVVVRRRRTSLMNLRETAMLLLRAQREANRIVDTRAGDVVWSEGSTDEPDGAENVEVRPASLCCNWHKLL